MITLAYKDFTAEFDPESLTWSSDDAVFAQLLNDSVDWDEAIMVSTPWEEGPRGTAGVDGVALARAIAVLGESVEVTRYEIVEPPDEVEGTVH